MRWLAVHLPALPLEVHARALASAPGGEPNLGSDERGQAPAAPASTPPAPPIAVSTQDRGERILRCNAAAAALGVRAGQGIGAARALCAGLLVRPHAPTAEAELLARLAAWCIAFTPVVSLSPPRALLLDVAASLQLFGGPGPLMERVRAGLTGLGHAPRLALAPTPLGALVLAIQGRELQAADLPALRRALGPLPIAALGPGPRERDDLSRMGLAQVADLLRLPRRGLRERLGPRRLEWIERLLGERPDPRVPYVPPAVHRARLELPGEVELTEGLVFPARRLLLELEGVLRGRQAGTRLIRWRLTHPEPPETAFEQGSARPRWRAEAWLELLRGTLERLVLPAPVRELALVVDEMVTLDPRGADCSPGLFPDLPGAPGVPDPALLDRLRARLGPASVHGLALAADHRPERASGPCEPGTPSRGMPRLDRPLWLLPEPRPLALRDGRPWLDGPLALGPERERIDTGWWDAGAVARDYFIATGPRGERLWVYHDLRGGRGWFLHGVFG